jgi:acid stress chaperone HdeB
MKHLLITAAVCLSASLLVSAPSLAKKSQMQNIDFGAITCGEFMKEISTSSAEDVGVFLMWIDGYLSGVSGDTVLNWENLEEFSAELVAYCGKKPDLKVLDAAEEVGIDDE